MSDGQAKALLYGAVLGDALGLAAEEAFRRGEIGEISVPPFPVQASAEIKHMWALTQTLGRTFAPTLELLLAEVAQVFAAESGQFVALRGLPIGYLYQSDLVKLKRVAEGCCQITHPNSEQVARTIAMAYLVKLALEGLPPDEWLSHVLAFIDGLSETLEGALLRVGHVIGWASPAAALGHINGRGKNSEALALAMALYCVIKQPDDYMAALRLAANHAPARHSVSLFTGILSAARVGLDAIPQVWREGCADEGRLFHLSIKLAIKRQSFEDGESAF